MNIKIISSLLLCIFMLSCTSHQYQQVYYRELESVNINGSGDIIYTFSESQRTLANGYIIDTRPAIFTTFLCPNGTEMSTEILWENGRPDLSNLCYVLRRFNQGQDDVYLELFSDHPRSSSRSLLED